MSKRKRRYRRNSGGIVIPFNAKADRAAIREVEQDAHILAKAAADKARLERLKKGKAKTTTTTWDPLSHQGEDASRALRRKHQARGYKAGITRRKTKLAKKLAARRRRKGSGSLKRKTAAQRKTAARRAARRSKKGKGRGRGRKGRKGRRPC